jgi:hypothetical protein
MTHDDLISIVRLPANVNADYEADLKELVDRYPYFVTTRVLYVKALQQSHSIHYASNLKIASIYCSSRRWLYFYLHPDKMLSNEPYQHNKNEKSSGDYFDMINRIESVGGDSKQSLKNLAEKLKSAREMVQMPIIQPVEKHVIQNNFQNSEKENPVLNSNSTEITIKQTEEISENNAKRLIIAHKYADAIEILRALNLNNPKKSVYFADQIRFLEKVLANSKK